MTVIHPIRGPCQVVASAAEAPPSLMTAHHGRGGVGGGASSSSALVGSVPKRHYCAQNPCINKVIHELHMQILQGNQKAEVELNRYLLACAVLDSKGNRTKTKKKLEACITWACDLCNSGKHDVSMLKQGYKQQFRAWKPPAFCCSSTPLKIPVSASLVTPLHCTLQYSLLPDLGMFFRGILQRRYYTDVSKKHWIRTMGCMMQGCSTSKALHQQSNMQKQAVLSRHYKVNWDYMQGICATLLLESIPCMKRAKRNNNHLSLSPKEKKSPLPVEEIMACINVMHGTLFKLYPLGAKTPTFGARVVMMQRMMKLTTMCNSQQQLEFMQRHPALMRICFMEYSINALMDWLPVERELLFESEAFGQHRTAMNLYRSIVVATCDVFRQDSILTGHEKWETLNSAASACIDRCIRVCKFKLFRMPEPIIKGPHLQPDQFLPEYLGKSTPMLLCREMALSMLGTEGWLLHSNLKVYALPRCVAIQQLESLDRLHSSCGKRLSAAQQVSFCCICAVNGRSASSSSSGGSGASYSASSTVGGASAFTSCKLRLCCQTGELSCITCPAGTVVTVNLVGVLLKICSTYYYMCPCCTVVRPWSSEAGMDLCPWMLSSSQQQIGRKCACETEYNIPSSNTTGAGDGGCMVCSCKSVASRATLLLPNAQERSMCRVSLCSKHAPPEHMLGMVTSLQQYKSMAAFYSQNSQSRRNSSR